MKNLLIDNINCKIKYLIPKELIIDGFNIPDSIAENLYEYYILNILNKEANLMLFNIDKLDIIDFKPATGFFNPSDINDEIFSVRKDNNNKLRIHWGWGSLEAIVEHRKRGLVKEGYNGGEIFKKVFKIKKP